MTPEQRSLRARLAANTRWAHERDRRAAGERGQNGLRARYEREIDPHGQLTADELAKRVENALRAHMQRMQLRSAQARQARRSGSQTLGSSPHTAGVAAGNEVTVK